MASTDFDQNNYGVALYYPFINVQDIDWLKSALLYWDHIRCITPSSDYFEDDIKYLYDEGIIIATNPKDYPTDASVKFVREMEKYCHNQGELDIRVINYLEGRFPELKNVTIHNDKLDERLYQEMGHKVVLGYFAADGVSRFYQAQPYISALYLITLASEMSKKIHIPMLTDIPGLAGLGEHILWSGAIIPENIRQGDILTQMNIPYPSVEDLERLSFDDIIRFRRGRNDERRRFRNTIEEIRYQSQSINDPNALADFFNAKKQEIQQAIDDHKKTLRDIGIKYFTSAIKVSWPSLPIGQIAGGTAGILSAIGLVGISLASNKTSISQEYRKAIKDCPWHYLISLEQNLR
jgi:cellulose biosynthesis protein BcsQ